MALYRSRLLSARTFIGLLSVSATLGASGCLTRPIEPLDSRTTSTFSDIVPQSRVDKIDLLLMIDNSASMADKQAILADAVPDLVEGLVNPTCLDEQGKATATQPKGPLDACQGGSRREFEPVVDIHIGIISSSLGGRGSTSCPSTEQALASNDDHAHLVARKDPAGGTGPDNIIPTYQNKGFLAWDPGQKQNPPGESEIGDLMGSTGIVPALRDMVIGVGQSGCGYEAPLESFYRFLVDPEPYKDIPAGNGAPVVLEGIDDELLTERHDFLRPDSLVAIVMLTDENDCSIRATGKAYLALEGSNGYHLPRARKECATDPNDPCCKSCGQDRGTCPEDPSCATPLSNDEDPVNLRCFDQKRRYGMDLLYPLDRYITALTSDKVPNRQGDLVDNPLFSKPEGSSATTARTPASGLVFLAGIVGVPWQDVARRDAQGKPDLLSGLDERGNAVGGFMNAKELSARSKDGLSGWDIILGDPKSGALPKDPLMIESREARTGTSPVTGDALAPSNSQSASANPINGHEWTTMANPNGDLQYACIFDLPTSKDCAMDTSCDCHDGANNPLCQDSSGSYTKTQYRAKAYPGLRELGVLEGLGEQGIVGSVCPAQISDKGRRDYGYRPAIGAIVDRLKTKFSAPCLPRPLTPDDDNHVSCLLIEGRKTGADQCSCEGLVARGAVSSKNGGALDLISENPAVAEAGLDCFCEITQLSDAELHACQYDTSASPVNASGEPINGWCYVDATTATGDPKLVEGCPLTEQRRIRFVGAGEPSIGSTLFIICTGE